MHVTGPIATTPKRGRAVADSYVEDAASLAVIKLVSREKNVAARLLTHPSRCRRNTAQARQLAMYLVHVSLGRSLTEVGRVFGRDRTTVSYACALIEDGRDDARFDAAVGQLELQIEENLLQYEQEGGHGPR
ncbi:helix-turn-helix domain-containing protein [Devosia algicola]|uniref:Helix-turn-helix domain-containing protein n=1 Tax=Devosia algicola TaxID=3026418 RepID=A0ABY7YN32_9HYPH|nr:helix-turn-helix domain-containing protein [Devosia algicola]WDR02729.1 helix-turn-helix domain-containing protein [Devosia algicola]